MIPSVRERAGMMDPFRGPTGPFCMERLQHVRVLVLAICCAILPGVSAARSPLPVGQVRAPDVSEHRLAGQRAAARDLHAGRPAVLRYGGGPALVYDANDPEPAGPTVDEATGLRIRHYGGGCEVGPETTDYVNGYNRAIFDHFRTRDLPRTPYAVPSGPPSADEIQQARARVADAAGNAVRRGRAERALGVLLERNGERAEARSLYQAAVLHLLFASGPRSLEESVDIKLHLFPDDPKPIACLNASSARHTLATRIEHETGSEWNDDWSGTLIRGQLLRRVERAMQDRSCPAPLG